MAERQGQQPSINEALAKIMRDARIWDVSDSARGAYREVDHLVRQYTSNEERLVVARAIWCCFIGEFDEMQKDNTSQALRKDEQTATPAVDLQDKTFHQAKVKVMPIAKLEDAYTDSTIPGEQEHTAEAEPDTSAKVKATGQPDEEDTNLSTGTSDTLPPPYVVDTSERPPSENCPDIASVRESPNDRQDRVERETVEANNISASTIPELLTLCTLLEGEEFNHDGKWQEVSNDLRQIVSALEAFRAMRWVKLTENEITALSVPFVVPVITRIYELIKQGAWRVL